MLHKSFKPAKCKTALKLAASRLKLLKNKRDAQLKQLKRELARLLESGQDQTARIRVEHVVREEKTMAAYDLIEIYCELIAARLPIIESQKNCPIDLKEAVSSVIFASPRCADIPELMDIRKHFTAKYGKEFVTAAVELRPDCGASRLLVEKLSAKAPDLATKIKVLSAIAEEHDVKWDPKLFGEKEMKPPEDLLNGPNTFQQASKMHEEHPSLEDPRSGIERLPPNFGASSKHYEKHDAPANSYGFNSQSSHGRSNSYTAIDATKAMPTDTSHPDPRPLGTSAEPMEFRHSYAARQDSYSAGRQSWTMEFKDATAAAQAAAESAERASMAARAAAELSSQGNITRQHSIESNRASLFRTTDEVVQNHVSSRSQREHIAKDSAHSTTHRSNSGLHYKQSFEENQQDDLGGLAERFNNLKSSYKPPRSVSLKSSSSVGDRPQVSDSQMSDRHSRRTSLELEKKDILGEARMKNDSSESGTDSAGEADNEIRSENVGYFEELSIRKQSTNASSHSHLQIPGGDLDITSSFRQQKFSEEVFKEPFDEEKISTNAEEKSSYYNAGVVFDDSGSDDDIYKFDLKGQHNDQDSCSYASSDGRKSSSHLLANSDTKSPRLNMEELQGKSISTMPSASKWHSTSVFSEGLTSDAIPSQADDLLAGTFDDSDGSASDSEEKQLNKSQIVGRTWNAASHKDVAYSSNRETPVSPHLMGSSLAENDDVRSSRNTWIQPSAADSGVEVHSPRNQGIQGCDETDCKFDDYLHHNHTSYGHSKSQSKFNDNGNSCTSSFSSVKDEEMQSLNFSDYAGPVKESSLESGIELNFGNLTGGLRNRGYKHSPYGRNPIEKHSASKLAEDNSTGIDLSSSSLKVDIGSGAQDQKVHQKLNKESRSGNIFPRSDARDELVDEHPRQTFYNSRELYIQNAKTEMNKKSGLGSYFDSDNSDSEDDHPKQTVTHSGPAFSRRTKASLSNSGRNLKSNVPPEPSMTTDFVAEKKSSSVSSYATENLVKPPSRTNSSDYRVRSEQNLPPGQDTPMPISQPKRTVDERLSQRSSYSTDTWQNPYLQSKSFGQRRSAESSRTVSESKRSSHEENPNASAAEQGSNPPPRKVASGGTESTTTSSSHNGPPSRENSISKASHVHPKLPDYDTLTAHLLSLRKNRQ